MGALRHALGQHLKHAGLGINPQDVAVIINAMNDIGQTRTGRMFATEVVKTHLLSRFSEIVPPMSEFSSHVMQDQPVVGVDDDLAVLNETMRVQDGPIEMTESIEKNLVVGTDIDNASQEE